MTNSFIITEDGQDFDLDAKILFQTANEFSMFITQYANSRGSTVTYAILHYCEDRDIDPADIAKLVSKSLKERLAVEMQESGLLPRESTGKLDA